MSRRGLTLFAAMSVIWGMPYLLIKIAVEGVPVPVLVLARVTIGAVLLLPVALRRRQLAALRPVWHWVVLFAAVEVIIPWFVLSDAERHITSSLSGLLIASVPIIMSLISLLISGADRLSLVRWTGLLIGLAGVVLLAGPHVVGPGASGGVARSVGEVLFVAVCYAIGPLVADHKLAGVPSVPVTTVSLSLAAVAYAPLAAIDWPSAVPPAKVLASLAGLGVICTALAFLLFFALIAEVGPARASVITYINPAIAVSLGVVVLGERVTGLMLAAFATILAGSVLATRRGRPSRQDPRGDRAQATATDSLPPLEISPDKGLARACHDSGPAGDRLLAQAGRTAGTHSLGGPCARPASGLCGRY